MTEEDILRIIRNDPWMMGVLRAARALVLPDWMIGAGFVRNKIWDHLHGFAHDGTTTADVDLIYFDPTDLSKETERRYDARLRGLFSANWQTKNQARMHEKHRKAQPYKNTEEALADWVETATCIAVRLENNDALALCAPHGIEDLVRLIVRPSPAYKNNTTVFQKRLREKAWREKWPKLTVLR